MTFLAIEALQSTSPANWPWCPLRRVMTLRRERNSQSRAILLAVSSDTGVKARPDDGGRQLPADSTIADYWLVRPGDIVFNPMWAIGGGVAASTISGAVSPAYRVYTPGPRILPRFAHYYLRCSKVIEQYALVVRGLTTFDRSVTREDFEMMPVPVPPLPVQCAIAAYLDTETARIDALIAKKRRMIDLAEERFESLIFQGISGQLTRSAKSTQYRSSGFAWLGSVPADWTLPPVTANFDVMLGKMLNADATVGPDQYPYLRNLNVQWDRLVLDTLATMHFDANDRRRYELRLGDLLVCEGGEVGRAAIWQGEIEPCFFQKAIHRIRPRINGNTRFLMYCLRAAADRSLFAVEGNQSTIVHLTAEKLRVHRFPYPSLAEQAEIVHILDSFRRQTIWLAKRVGRQVDLLIEHRQTLITAAVTGVLEVPVPEVAA